MTRQESSWLPSVWIALFFAFLALPFLQMHWRVYPEFDNLENREMASLPTWEWRTVGELPNRLNAYLNDHFGFRPDLIRWNCILRMKLLGSSPLPMVIPGRDSWLFYRAEAVPDGNTLNDFLGAIPLSEAELEGLKERLKHKQKTFERLGIPYLVVIAPNKSTIHGEYLVERRKRKRAATRLDQLMAHLRSADAPLAVLDLREVLLEGKRDGPVFYKTDSHWNRLGAYLGYREVVRKLSGSLPGLAPAGLMPGSPRAAGPMHGGDLAKMLYMQDLLPEENEMAMDLAPEEHGPRWGALILRHDSFGDALYPYLRRHFSKIVNLAPFAPFDMDRIVRERPSAVVHIFVERYITQAIHDSFFHGTPGQ
ncbi:MAG: hypothetical protein MUF52_00610 [Syntrophobacteraceae bacterium]|jgi:hypothetical protein|nr:hypothetical protein [Syntrophobacteraceae bacterium]